MTDPQAGDRNRLEAVSAAGLRPDSLVGSFFLSSAQLGWQGCVVAEPSPGVYLVETFDWVMGASHDQQLVQLDEMVGWTFYDSADWMQNAYEHGVRQRWERQRQGEAQADTSKTRTEAV